MLIWWQNLNLCRAHFILDKHNNTITNNHNQPTSKHTISQWSQSVIITIMPSDNQTHNSTEELYHPNIIKVALHVSHNQKLSYGLWVVWGHTLVLWRLWSHTTTLPALKTRQDITCSWTLWHINMQNIEQVQLCGTVFMLNLHLAHTSCPILA